MDGLHVTQTDYQRVTPVDDASLYSAIGDYSITPLSFTSAGYNEMTIGAFKAVIAGRLVELESDFNVTLPSNLYGVLMYYTWDLSKVNTIDEATGVVTDNQNAIKSFPLNNTTIPQDTVNPSAPKGQRLIGGYINSSALSLPASWGSDYIHTIRPYRETHQYSANYLIAGNNTVRCTRVGNVASMSVNEGKIGTAITLPTTTLCYIPDLDMHPTVNQVVSPASFGYQWWSTDIRVQPAFMGSTVVQPACVLLGYAFSVKGTQDASNPIPVGHNFVWGVSYAVKPPIDALSATLGFSQDSTVVDNDIQLYGRNLLINTSSSATNGQTTMQGASASIYGAYSRTDSYEQITNPDPYQYYRFVDPDTNKTYGLTPGETYTLSGSASLIAGTLKFKSEYSTDGKNWSRTDLDDLEIPVSDGSVFAPFSHTFTIPIEATGVYFSLQNYDYTDGGLFRFKGMKLEKGSKATPWTPAPEDVI